MGFEPSTLTLMDSNFTTEAVAIAVDFLCNSYDISVICLFYWLSIAKPHRSQSIFIDLQWIMLMKSQIA